MSTPRSRRSKAREGLTMVELLFALAILSVLMVLVFQLIDRTLNVWRKSETRRSLLEQAASVSELFAHDVRGLENGAHGDLVLEWVRFDTDADGVAETKWPRLRLVRQASAAEVSRLREADLAERGPRPAAALTPPSGRATDGAAPSASADTQRVLRASPGLVEVIWLVAPASLVEKDARAEGVLWRGERLVDDSETKSFFASDFLGSSGRPPAGATDAVTGGVLWMQVLFAAQTSVVHDGWKQGLEPSDAAAAWDAWGRDRPDAHVHPWNEKHPGIVPGRERPALPRRARLELEFERPQDRLRRTHLVEIAELGDARIAVDDGARLPEPGAFVLIDAEWMQIASVDGNAAVVKRGARGTTPLTHAKESMVHWGAPLAREVLVNTCREDWKP